MGRNHRKAKRHATPLETAAGRARRGLRVAKGLFEKEVLDAPAQFRAARREGARFPRCALVRGQIVPPRAREYDEITREGMARGSA